MYEVLDAGVRGDVELYDRKSGGEAIVDQS